MNLKVPFAEKDEAKKLGARWDAGRKVWYVQGREDLGAFSRWSPTPHDPAAGEVQAPQRPAARKQTTSSTLQVGSKYVELPRVCDCLPWDVCDKCRATALSS